MPPVPVYQYEPAPKELLASIYLVGPTPKNGRSVWRARVLEILEARNYNGVVFLPELRPGLERTTLDTAGYEALMEEEEEKFQMSDVYFLWRGDDEGSGTTSNFHVGRFIDSGRAVVGAPPTAKKARYPRYLANKLQVPVGSSIEEAVTKTLELLGEGMLRSGGMRFIPPFVARTEAFKSWYAAQLKAEHRLDYAEVLWSWRVGPNRKITFLWLIYPKLWSEKEQRYKANEVLLARPDIAVTVLIKPAERFDDYEVTLVEEMRSAASNPTGRVHENPGGSSWKEGVEPAACAIEELREETTLILAEEDFRFLGARQLAPTISPFKAHVFWGLVNDEHMAKVDAQKGIPHGVVEDGEQAYTYRNTIGNIRRDPQGLVGWGDLGMVLDAALTHYLQREKERISRS